MAACNGINGTSPVLLILQFIQNSLFAKLFIALIACTPLLCVAQTFGMMPRQSQCDGPRHTGCYGLEIHSAVSHPSYRSSFISSAVSP